MKLHQGTKLENMGENTGSCHKYKRYLESGDESLSRTTKWRRRNKIDPSVNISSSSDLNEQYTLSAAMSADSSIAEDRDRAQWSQAEDTMDEPQATVYCNRDDDFLYEGSETTLTETVLLVSSFAVRYSLSACAIDDMLKLLSLLLPSGCKLPRTHHLFKKLLPNQSQSVMYSYCCNVCEKLVLSGQNVCVCGANINEKVEQAAGNFFLSLDLADQIKSTLELAGVGQSFRTHDCNTTFDIVDSRIYKSEHRLSDANNLSLTWNADGVPAFQQSRKSIWPIRCLINELPFEVSRKHILIAALWFGNGKPNISTFTSLFINIIDTINRTGITWKHPITGQFVCSLVFPVCCASDAVARCSLQGIHQFNGAFGCTWCIDKGEVVPKGRGHVRVYVNRRARARTHEHMVLWGRQLIETDVDHVRGVKAVSPLLLLRKWGFNMVDGFSVEYMHCVLLGAVKQFLTVWINSTNADAYHLSTDDVVKIDACLMAAKPSNDVSRLPSSIVGSHRWKANECRAWLIHYSVLALQDALPAQYLNHWALLVKAVFSLLQVNVTADDVNSSRGLLSQFVSDTIVLYGKQHLSYNIHQLTHLADSVLASGPLWRTSAFAFESHNQQIIKLFHGYSHISIQIAQSFTTLQSLPKLLRSSDIGLNVSTQCQSWLLGYPLVKKALRIEQNVTVVGRSVERAPDNAEAAALARVCSVQLSDMCLFYDKAIVCGKPFTSINYKFNTAAAKRINYLALLRNGDIVIIHSFIIDSITNCLHIYCETLSTVAPSIPFPVDHYRAVRRSQRYVAIAPLQLVSKCILLRTEPDNLMLVSLQPNILECD